MTERCPTCNSPSPERHPAVQFEGEVNICSDTWHKPAVTPLQKLENICEEIFARWDKDQRSGKLLSALSGHLANYRADVDAVRAALGARDKTPAA